MSKTSNKSENLSDIAKDLKIHENKTNKKWNNYILRGLIVLSIIIVIFLSTTSSIPLKEEMYHKHYKDIVKLLEKRGFREVNPVPLKDLPYGNSIDSEIVNLVTVGGADWGNGRALKTQPINVYYHSPKSETVTISLNLKKSFIDIKKELKRLGFNDITEKPILLPIQNNEKKKDKTKSISFGGYTYKKGYFYSKNFPVTITYYDVNMDNIMITEDISQKNTKSEIEKYLKDIGFTNLKFLATPLKNKSMHEKIKSIEKDSPPYIQLHKNLVLKKDEPILINHYDFSKFYELPKELNTSTVNDTKSFFTNSGFVNIIEKTAETNEISKHGYISVEVNGQSFNTLSDKIVEKNSKIVITYWSAEKAIKEKEAQKKAEELQRKQINKTTVTSVPQPQSPHPNAFVSPPQPATQSSGNVYYANCTIAKAAGVTPLYVGEPGYASHLDRDGDGIACEW